MPAPASPRRRSRKKNPSGYAALSQRPLHILAFLLPFLILYEIGSVAYLTRRGPGGLDFIDTIRAHAILASFFDAFGAAGLFLPGIALITVLLLWHILTRDPWRLRPAILPVMAAESLAWTLPLLLLGVILHAPAASAPSPADLLQLPWQARLTISIGAGLYEELLFRMILIALFHFLLVDLARLADTTGRILAVILSAAAFALYHDLASPAAHVDPARAAFFFSAGLYFGALYLSRGFGITVAVHILYDTLVLVVFHPPPA